MERYLQKRNLNQSFLATQNHGKDYWFLFSSWFSCFYYSFSYTFSYFYSDYSSFSCISWKFYICTICYWSLQSFLVCQLEVSWYFSETKHISACLFARFHARDCQCDVISNKNHFMVEIYIPWLRSVYGNQKLSGFLADNLDFEVACWRKVGAGQLVGWRRKGIHKQRGLPCPELYFVSGGNYVPVVFVPQLDHRNWLSVLELRDDLGRALAV